MNCERPHRDNTACCGDATNWLDAGSEFLHAVVAEDAQSMGIW